MKENSRENCSLQTRDGEILKTLDLFKVLSLEQIWAAFFKEMHPDFWNYLFLSKRGRTDGCLSAAYQRMGKLTRLGYVESRYQWGYSRAYRLDERGYRHLLRLGETRFSKAPFWPRKGELEHALLLSALGLFFLRVMGVPVISERQLASKMRLAKSHGRAKYRSVSLPDMVILHKENRYRLELELSYKSHKEYVSRWERLGDIMHGVKPIVLYLAKASHLKKMIVGIAGEHYFPAVYATELEEFIQRGGQVFWRNFQGKEFQFNEAKEVITCR